MTQLTPVARAYHAFTAAGVRVVRQVGVSVDPSAWERRDRFTRGGPTLGRGADAVALSPPTLAGDDIVWDRVRRTFKRHEDPFYRAYYAAETFRKLPFSQRERLTRDFWQQYPMLIPLFLLNTWAPPLEAALAEVGRIGREVVRTVISDFRGLLVPVKAKDMQSWNATNSGTSPAKRR